MMYERGEYQPYFQLTTNEVPLFSETATKLWLNGLEYHQDEDKTPKVEELQRALGDEALRGLMVAQLSGRVGAIFRLSSLASGTLDYIRKYG